MSIYDVYYLNQAGAGGRGVSNVYVGSPRMRGHGLGSWFSGIFRSALPFLAKGAKAIGKEALRAGVNVLDDVTENNASFKDAFNNRMTESGQNLKRKATEKLHKLMEGSGYTPFAPKRRAQSRRGKRRRRTPNSRVVKKKRKRVTKPKRPTKRKTKKKSITSSRKRKSKKKKKNLDIFG